MPKGTERRDERITIRIPPSLRPLLEHAAEEDGRSVSDFIVRTLQLQLTKPRRRS